MPLSAEAGFALTERDVTKAWGPRTRGLVLASPANPTGAVSSRAALQGLSEAAASRGGWALFDEIYQGLTYPQGLDDQPALPAHGVVDPDRVGTVLSLQGGADHEFFVNSFSKYFGMTGWRVGWLVAPRAAIPAIEKLAQNAYIAPSTVGQHGALAALAPDVMPRHEARRLAYFRARNRLVTGLRALGFSVPVVPEGAFYVYATLPPEQPDSEPFCRALLEGAAVAATPGTDFGDARRGPERAFLLYRAPGRSRRGARAPRGLSCGAPRRDARGLGAQEPRVVFHGQARTKASDQAGCGAACQLCGLLVGPPLAEAIEVRSGVDIPRSVGIHGLDGRRRHGVRALPSHSREPSAPRVMAKLPAKSFRLEKASSRVLAPVQARASSSLQNRWSTWLPSMARISSPKNCTTEGSEREATVRMPRRSASSRAWITASRGRRRRAEIAFKVEHVRGF